MKLLFKVTSSLALLFAAGAVTAEDSNDPTATFTAKNQYGSVSAGNAFNPSISIILDGVFYQDNQNGQADTLLNEVDGTSHLHNHSEEDHGHEHSGLEEGFNLRETELTISATVDNYFDAAANLALTSSGSVEIEEAWFQTRKLPAGLKIKAGKFLSGIGYLNDSHPHSWDFTDQNLAYRNLLGVHGLQDTGLQLTWLPDLSVYTLFGVEALQGSQEKFGSLVEDGEGLNEHEAGPRLITAFAKVAPDLGYSHALQLGSWIALAKQHQEQHGDADTEVPVHTVQGDAQMVGFDAVYKYDNSAAHGEGDFKLQAEYLLQKKDLNMAFHAENPSVVGAERAFTEDGFYMQGVYGIAARWQLGLRYDVVGLTNELKSAGNTLTDWDNSDRWTLAMTWSPTEFSRLRFQYASADLSIESQSQDVSMWNIQWLMSLGAHGAHKF